MYEPRARSEVSQGDVFSEVPINYTLLDLDGHLATDDDGNTLPPQIRMCKAIILNRDCDYDKSAWVIVAEVRSLEEIAPGHRGNVRKYRALNTFYLEAVDGVIDESYVDFRRIDRINKAIVENLAAQGNRMLSLTDDGRDALRTQIAMFFGLTAEELSED